MRRASVLLSSFVCLTACAGAGVVSESARPQAPSQYPGQLTWTFPEAPDAKDVEPPDGINAPNPAPEPLAATRTAMSGASGVVGAVAFCVDPGGAVASVGTATSTSDAELDGVLRDTVQGWQFEPARLQGQPVRACAKATFELSFR